MTVTNAIPDYSSFKGRKKIITPYVDPRYDGFGFPVMSDADLPTIIQDALEVHYDNRRHMDVLKNYHDGVQAILDRSKEIRPNINHKVVAGLPKSSTDLMVGYFFSKPLTYIPRQNSNYEVTSELNRVMDDLGVEKVNQEVLRDMCMYGVGYKIVLPDVNRVFGNQPVYIKKIDARNTFMIYSQVIGEPLLAAVHVNTFAENGAQGDLKGGMYNLITVYLNGRTIVFKHPLGATLDWSHIVSDVRHLLPIPIIGYEMNEYRQGLYEQALSVVDAINVLLSDGVNDVAQLVQSIMVAINTEVDEETLAMLKESHFITLQSPAQGVSADLKFISNQLNPENSKFLIGKLEHVYASVTNTPVMSTTNSDGGQDTGKAQLIKSGYHSMEMLASGLEQVFEDAERKALALVREIFSITNNLRFDVEGIEVKFSRNKADNLTEKASAMRNLVDSGIIAPIDAIELADLTTDPLSMAERGEEYRQQKLEEVRQDTLMAQKTAEIEQTQPTE